MKKSLTNLFLLAAAVLLPAVAGAQCNMTLPYSDNFDSYASTEGTSMPDCWTRVAPFQVNAGSNNALRPNLTTAYNHGKVVSFMGQASSSQGTGVMKIATPLIPTNLNQLEISFEVYKSGLTVYLATDLDDEDSYVLMGTYSPGYTWTTYEIRTDTMSAAPEEEGYLVFCGTYSSSGYSTALLDNLNITALISCARTMAVTVDAVTPTTASLSWLDVDDAIGYKVSYSTENDLANAQYVETAYNNVVLSGLEPDTRYYYFVQTHCSNEFLSNPRVDTFWTERVCYPITNLHQVSVGYDAASFAWDMDPRGYEATQVMVTLVDDSDPQAEPETHESDAPNYHFFADLNPQHHYTAYFYTVCDIYTSVANTMAISFKPCGESELAALSGDHSYYPVNTGYKYSIAQMVYPATVLYDMDTIRGIALHRSINPEHALTAVTRTLSIWVTDTNVTSLNGYTPVTGMTQVVNNVDFVLPEQEWDTILFTTPYHHDGISPLVVTIDDNTGSYNVGGSQPQWMWHEAEWNMYYAESNSTNYIPTNTYSLSHTGRLPDIQFVGDCERDYTCLTPVMLVGEVDSASIELLWVESGGSEWVVEYRMAGTGAWQTVGNFESSPVVIENLLPSTSYEVRMGTVCGDDIHYAAVQTITTNCAIAHIPFHFSQNDMSNAYSQGFPSCWNWSQHFFRHKLSDMMGAGTRYTVYNQGNGEWFMLPRVAEHLSGAKLVMWVASSDQGFVKVGIAGQSDCSDVEWLDTVPIPAGNVYTSHDNYTVYLDNYTGTGDRVVVSPIVNNDYHFIYFFDFHIEAIEGCRPVANITIDSTDASTMSVSWTPVGGSTSWYVEIDEDHNGTVEGEPSFTFTGLQPYTDYTVTVKALCDGDAESNPTTAVFRSGCEDSSCFFTVNGHASSGNGWKGGYLNIMAGEVSVGNVKMLRGSNTSQTFTVCADMELTFSWLSGNADNECSFSILNANGDVVYSTPTAENLGQAFFVKDSICYYQTPGGPIDPIDPPDPPEPPTGIDMTHADASVSLFPNPASGSVTLAGLERGASVRVLDISGREVMRVDGVAERLTLGVEALAKGAYFVRIVGEGSSIVKKLIVR